MAIRTTATEVKQIIDTDLLDSIVDAYIVGASALVDNVLGSDTTLSDTLKEQIEMWLTAHMMASTRELQPAKEGGGPAPSITYQGKWDQNLSSTSYGQMAMTLDTTGKLRDTSNNTGASIRAVTSF